MHGTSFLYSLADADAAERHTQQYFEILGNRGMYKDGWWLSWMMPRIPWKARPRDAEGVRARRLGSRDDPVELYYLPDDFTQAKNVADQHPEKVEELKKLFWEEAERYDVLPAARRADRILRDAAADPDAVAVHLLRRRPERGLGDDPADLQPLLHDQRRPRDPRRRRRGSDRGRGRPPGRLLALRAGRQAQAHLLVPGRSRVQAGVGRAAADRGASTCAWSSPPTRPSPPRAAR